MVCLARQAEVGWGGIGWECISSRQTSLGKDSGVLKTMVCMERQYYFEWLETMYIEPNFAVGFNRYIKDFGIFLEYFEAKRNL